MTVKDTLGATEHRYRAELVDTTSDRIVVSGMPAIIAHGGCSYEADMTLLIRP